MVKKELSSARAAPNPGIGSFRIILLMEASLKSYFRLLTWLLKSVGREIMYVMIVYLNESITKHGLTPNSTSHQSYPLVHPLHLSFWVHDYTMSRNLTFHHILWYNLYTSEPSLTKTLFFIISSGSTYTFESKYHSQNYTKPSIISSESICTSESRRPYLSSSPLVQPTTHLSINNVQKLGPNLPLSAPIQVMHPSL